MVAYLHVVQTVGLFRNILATHLDVMETIGLFRTL